MSGRLRGPLHSVFGLFAPTNRRDLLIGTGFTLAGALEFGGRVLSQPARFVGALPFLVALFSITLRRQRPLLPVAAITAIVGAAALAASLIPGLAQGGGGPASIIFGLLFATFSLGMHGNRRDVALGAPLPLLMITVISLLDPANSTLVGALTFFALFVVGAPLLVGRLLRDRSRLVAELRRQEALLHAAREASVEAARAGEKLELAALMQAILSTGLDRLVAQVKLAQVAGEQHRLSAVGGIETMARTLLGELGQVLSSISPGADQTLGAGGGVPVVLDRTRAQGRDDEPAKSAGADMTVGRANTQLQATPPRMIARWDLWLAAALFAGLIFQLLTNTHLGVDKAVAILACLAVAAPLLEASRRPLLTVAASTVGAAIFATIVLPLTDLFTAVVLLLALPFVVGAFEERRRALIGLSICLLSTLAVRGLDAIVGITPLLVGAWLAGRMLRDRTRLASVVRETNRRLVLEQEANDRRIVLEERARVAREVHDVIGHSLTVVALQAGAARRLWDRNREKAESALVTIEGVVEAGVRDLSRGDDLDGSLMETSAKAPHALEIHELVERAQLAGLTVGLHVNGCEAELNPAAELAAYRLVQEALTNVLKHVPGATAEISLRYSEAGLEVAVNNAIKVSPLADPAAGRGLRGMRERVSACGGTLDWGPNPAGEFEVRAWFPVATQAR
jgi:signal transduction histidine kinase